MLYQVSPAESISALVDDTLLEAPKHNQEEMLGRFAFPVTHCCNVSSLAVQHHVAIVHFKCSSNTSQKQSASWRGAVSLWPPPATHDTHSHAGAPSVMSGRESPGERGHVGLCSQHERNCLKFFKRGFLKAHRPFCQRSMRMHKLSLIGLRFQSGCCENVPSKVPAELMGYNGHKPGPNPGQKV